MTRGVKIALLIFAGFIVLLALGLVAIKCITDHSIKDKNGMINDAYSGVEIRPADGSSLTAGYLDHSGSVAEACYSYYLWAEDGEVYFSCSLNMEGGDTICYERKPVDPAYLSKLNTLALGLDLTEANFSTPDPDIIVLDADSASFGFVWDDGTSVCPDQGFDEVKQFFDTLVYNMKEG